MKKLITNQNGQGIMEYIIISSLIGIFCLAVIKGFGTTLQDRVENMSKKIKKSITIR